jgi:hypothetical protein
MPARVPEQILKTSPRRRVRTVTAAYTVTLDDDEFVRGNATGGAFSITLPTAASCFDTDTGTGKVFEFKKTDASGNAVTIDGAAAETNDGAATFALAAQYETLRIVSNGTGWDVCGTDRAAGIQTADIAASQITNALMADDAIDSAEIADGAIDLVHMSANSIDSDQYVDGSIDTAHFAAGAVDAAALATGAVTPVKIATGEVAPAADAPIAITSTTRRIRCSTASGADTTISTSSSVDGQRVSIYMEAAAGGGSARLVTTAGTLLLNAAEEAALVERVGSDWVVLSREGATYV